MKQELRVEIPNGSMVFRMETVLREGSMRMVKKVFRMICGLPDREVWLEDIREYLGKEEEKERGRQQQLAVQLEIADTVYRQLKTPGIQIFTNRKEAVGQSKALCVELRRKLSSSRRLMARYEKIRDMVDSVEKGGRG